jgi:hypothetical protein
VTCHRSALARERDGWPLRGRPIAANPIPRAGDGSHRDALGHTSRHTPRSIAVNRVPERHGACSVPVQTCATKRPD